MPLFCLFAIAVLGVTMLDGIAPAGGFVWDFLNGLGFGALAGLVYLGWDSESPARQPRLRLHSSFALSAVALAGACRGLTAAPPGHAPRPGHAPLRRVRAFRPTY